MLAKSYRNHFALLPAPAPEKGYPWARDPALRGCYQPLAKRGGEAIVPDRLQKDFLLQLSDHNALQRLGMIVQTGLTQRATFAKQDSVVEALWRNDGGSAHTFEDHGLSISSYDPGAISLSLTFPRTLAKGYGANMATYIESMLYSEAGRAIEAACLVGSGSSGQPLGILTEAAQSGSAAHVQSFGSGGVATSDLVAMRETLGAQGAGIAADQCGWVCHPEFFTDLLALSSPDGTGPLITTQNNRQWALGLPVEISANMPTTKLLLIHAQQAVRLLMWEPGPDILIDEFTVAGKVRVLATLYVNVALPRTGLIIVGQ